MTKYDTIIIGLGCAGYTAAIYSARYKLSTLLVGMEDGGLGLTAAEVGNWPGEVDITGPDLMEKFKKHAVSFEEVTHKIARVSAIKKKKGGFTVEFDGGETAEGKTIIFATGSRKRHLGIPGEEEYSGKGGSGSSQRCVLNQIRKATVSSAGRNESSKQKTSL
jgi:thioredoxin reductase